MYLTLFSYRQIRLLATLLVAAASLSTVAEAQVLFSDTFNRPSADDINASAAGVTNNVGIDPNAGFYVENYNAGGVSLRTNIGTVGPNGALTDVLNLADGPGTSNAYINHNFIDASIITAGGFSVSVDLVGGTINDSGQGAGFAIGMSEAEAIDTGDAHDGGGSSSGNFKFQDGIDQFSSPTGGNTTNDVAVSDFWVTLVGDNNLGGAAGTSALVVWGGLGNTIDSQNYDFSNSRTVGAETGTLAANFSFSDFNAGSTVNYEIGFDGDLITTGSFTWSGSTENFIGLDGRGAVQGFDNLVISTDPVPLQSFNPTLTINRDTGNMTLSNPSLGNSFDLIGYTVQSVQGEFNSDPNTWNQMAALDPNGGWIQLTAPGNPVRDLSEATLDAGFTVDPNDTIDFGNVWIQSPFEDIVNVDFRAATGETIPVTVVFEGNGGNSFDLGDFNFNGSLDPNDWAILRSNLISDPNEQGLLAYGMGDINLDGLINESDFDEFKIAFDTANFIGAFQAMITGVPEPTTFALIAFAGVIAAVRRSRTVLTVTLVVTLCGVSIQDTNAQTNLYTDSFDRSVAQLDDIDSDPNDPNNPAPNPNGITGTVGAVTLVENGDDIFGTLASLTNVENNQLNLADGPNASTFYINHNFTDSAITTDGVLSISVDLVSNNGASTSADHFVGFGLGSTLAEHQTQDNYDFETGIVEGSQKAVRGRSDIDNLGFSDLWVGWSPNNNGTVQIFRNGVLVQSLDDGITNINDPNSGYLQPTDTLGVTSSLEVRMEVADFNAGSAVPVTVYFDGVAVGGDAFRWDNSNANYVGVNSRQSQDGFAVDDLAITTSVSPIDVQTMSLEVYTDTGEVFLVGGPSASSIDRYTISSNSGLDPNAFNGIGGDDPNVPLGDGSGNGWELGGVQTDSLLNEFYLGATGEGSSTLGTSYRSSLGFIYDTVADTQDLIVEYRLTDGSIVSGIATYTTAPGGLLADVNGDDRVNSADFFIIQRGLGTIYDSTDLANWEAEFGMSLTTSSTTSIPEPASMLMLISGLGVLAGGRRSRQSK